MSKKISLNDCVKVKLTEVGLNEYIKRFSYKTEKEIQEIRDNDMWLREQFWIVMNCFSEFGQCQKNSFTEIVFEDFLLEDYKQPLEDSEIEKIAKLAIDNWLSKSYNLEPKRYLGYNKKRPDYITLSFDNIFILEYKPAIIPGQYHISMAFGVKYPTPDKRTRSLLQIKNLLLKNGKNRQALYEKSAYKIESDIIDWCDNRNYYRADYDILVERAAQWGIKAGSKRIRKALDLATEYMIKAEKIEIIGKTY